MKHAGSQYDFNEELDGAMPGAWFMSIPGLGEVVDYTCGEFRAQAIEHGIVWAAEKLSYPTSKGTLYRLYKASSDYNFPLIVEDETEVRERNIKFRENMLQLAKDFGTIWEGHKSELLEIYRPFKEFNLKEANTIELAMKLRDLCNVNMRMNEIHFYGMYTTYCLFTMFEEFCKEVLGIDASNEEFSAMLRGFDNKGFQSERELWRLSRRVQELDLTPHFQFPAPEVPPRIKKIENGKKWLSELDDFLDEYGWRNEWGGWLACFPSWREDPRHAIAEIKHYLKVTNYTPIENMQKAVEKRERTIAKVLPRVPEDKRELFNLLLKGGQYADVFSEEHGHYCDNLLGTLLRMFLLEFGKRFAQAGNINEPDDIFCLSVAEIRKTAMCPERWRLQPLVEERKAIVKAAYKEGYPAVISKTMNDKEAFDWLAKSRDPIMVMVRVGKLPKPKPELKADLIGNPGAPGIAEGHARVIVNENQLDEIQPGEILVAPITTSSWVPIFAIVKAVVVDRGGILSHPAVVAREYGLPCIVNTFVGTSKIKTGQKIRVDGNQGTIYILE